MKKLLTVALFASLGLASRADIIVMYDGGEPAATETNVAATVAANVSASLFLASNNRPLTFPAGNNPSSGNAISSTGWNTNLTSFFEFTVTPNSGFTMDLTSLTFDDQRSGTGPTNFYVRYSVDNFASDIGFGTNVAAFTANPMITVNLTDSGVTGVTFRVHAENATSGAGTYRLDNIQLNGTVIPEPASMTLFGIGAAAALWYRRRQHA